MTLFEGFGFFALLVLLCIPAVILGMKEKNRTWYILIASALMDALAIGADRRMWIFFVAFVVWETLLVKVYLALYNKKGRVGGTYALFIVLSILPLALCKLSEIAPMSLFQILGISYLTFKASQVIIETYDGLIREIRITDFLTFLLFFPSVSSGPIDRSRRFEEDINQKMSRSEYLDLAGEGLWKLTLGIAYKFVFAALVYKGVDLLETDYSLLGQIGYAYSYGVYMFFDFAGYSLMAVGASYLFGIRTPDNFDKPFISKDMLEFWRRWHMTLSFWFKDFIFTRVVMRGMKHKWFKNKLQAASWGFMVDMFVMGIWHGLHSYYILYGLYHGILLMLTQIWQKKSKFYKKHKKEKWYQILSWAVTMQLVMFGFLLFSGHLTAGFGWKV